MSHDTNQSGWHPVRLQSVPLWSQPLVICQHKPPAFCADNPKVCTTSDITVRAVMATLIKYGRLDMHHARFAIRMSLVEIEIESRTQGRMRCKSGKS